MTESLREILNGMEKTVKRRLANLNKNKPVKNLLEINGLELVLRFLGDAKEKHEKGEPVTADDMDFIKKSLDLAELGANIDVLEIMDNVHS